jgi:hypothetical protein
VRSTKSFVVTPAPPGGAAAVRSQTKPKTAPPKTMAPPKTAPRPQPESLTGHLEKKRSVGAEARQAARQRQEEEQEETKRRA